MDSLLQGWSQGTQVGAQGTRLLLRENRIWAGAGLQPCRVAHVLPVASGPVGGWWPGEGPRQPLGQGVHLTNT